MNFSTFSPKQLKVLCWWCSSSPHRDFDAIICDGAVRSGKTICMSLSFILWSFYYFNNQSFALCGKTILSLGRNLVRPLMNILRELGYDCSLIGSKNMVVIKRQGITNYYHLFGGRDKSSQDLIQGLTVAGILFDEVALMPRSFVEQGLARCSVRGSKFWFNCNPEDPEHWFYKEWILKKDIKKALYLHFTMDDNPSLDSRIIKRYQSLYTGRFYERYVEGRWVAAEGLVYPRFDERIHTLDKLPTEFSEYHISCDYGTVNPSSFGLWGKSGGRWYRIDEYYYDSKKEKLQRTDQEHYAALEELAKDYPVSSVVVDPSAASFIECIKRYGRFRVVRAKNDLLDGIRRVAAALVRGEILFYNRCRDTIREFSLYRWDDRGRGDIPIKRFDHAMDDIRYFVSTILDREYQEDNFIALTAQRNQSEEEFYEIF